MTSSSSLGSASVTLQFDINRDIDAAARDVQAAINAARSQLPSLSAGRIQVTGRRDHSRSAYPSFLTLTSDVVTKPQIYDHGRTRSGASILSQIRGWARSSSVAARNPAVLAPEPDIRMLLGNNGWGSIAVRTALGNANANAAKGSFQNGSKTAPQNRRQRPDPTKASDYAPI